MPAPAIDGAAGFGQSRSMTHSFDRRSLILAAGATALSSRALGSPSRFAQLEQAIGGRVGVYAQRDGDPQVVSNRPNERFAMCSTFKAPLAAFIFDEIANGGLDADRPVRIDQTPLIGYSPEVEPRRSAGGRYMSLAGLARAAAVVSDNTAANILLEQIGGPDGFTARVRKFEGTTRLDRIEPDLNENTPGDPRDTTTPKGMATLLSRLLFQTGFSQKAAAETRALMIDSRTGFQRLRAGLPPSAVVGDKTGTSLNGLFGDIGFVQPADGGAPIIVAAYVDAPGLAMDAGNNAHREIGRIVTEAFGI